MSFKKIKLFNNVARKKQSIGHLITFLITINPLFQVPIVGYGLVGETTNLLKDIGVSGDRSSVISFKTCFFMKCINCKTKVNLLCSWVEEKVTICTEICHSSVHCTRSVNWFVISVCGDVRIIVFFPGKV